MGTGTLTAELMGLNMNDLRTAAQQALLTLEWHLAHGAYGADIEGVTGALRAALAKPEKCSRRKICEREVDGYCARCHEEMYP